MCDPAYPARGVGACAVWGSRPREAEGVPGDADGRVLLWASPIVPLMRATLPDAWLDSPFRPIGPAMVAAGCCGCECSIRNVALHADHECSSATLRPAQSGKRAVMLHVVRPRT